MTSRSRQCLFGMQPLSDVTKLVVKCGCAGLSEMISAGLGHLLRPPPLVVPIGGVHLAAGLRVAVPPHVQVAGGLLFFFFCLGCGEVFKSGSTGFQDQSL